MEAIILQFVLAWREQFIAVVFGKRAHFAPAMVKRLGGATPAPTTMAEAIDYFISALIFMNEYESKNVTHSPSNSEPDPLSSRKLGIDLFTMFQGVDSQLRFINIETGNIPHPGGTVQLGFRLHQQPGDPRTGFGRAYPLWWEGFTEALLQFTMEPASEPLTSGVLRSFGGSQLYDVDDINVLDQAGNNYEMLWNPGVSSYRGTGNVGNIDFLTAWETSADTGDIYPVHLSELPVTALTLHVAEPADENPASPQDVVLAPIITAGDIGIIAYQWFNADGDVLLPGETGPTFTVGATFDLQQFYCVVYNTLGQAQSRTADVQVI